MSNLQEEISINSFTFIIFNNNNNLTNNYFLISKRTYEIETNNKNNQKRKRRTNGRKRKEIKGTPFVIDERHNSLLFKEVTFTLLFHFFLVLFVPLNQDICNIFLN